VTLLEILAPKKIHTRKNLDPNPPEVAFDPKKIIQKSQKELSESHKVFLERTFSLPKDEVRSLDHIPFVVKFEKSFVRTKSKSYLSKTVFDIGKFKYLFSTSPGVSSPKPDVSSLKSSVSSQVSTPK
jgi:hypothetical protein